MDKRKEEIYHLLDSKYPEEISFLESDDEFEFLIKVMLSASSTDKRAELSSSLLFASYPTVSELAQADEKDIEKLIHSSGLGKTKSHNIKKVAEFVAQNGSLPSTFEELIKLPGVGEKTASCYLAHVYNEPAVIADTHFVRVANRLGLTSSTDRLKSFNEIRKTFPKEYWTRLSMTVNLHGRTLCRPKPKCNECFLSSICKFSKDAQK